MARSKSTRQLREKQEDGAFPSQLEVSMDAGSLFDIHATDSEPTPRDYGSVLTLKRVRERILSEAITAVTCTTQDMITGCTTKPGVDTATATALMTNGQVGPSLSVLRNVRILNAHRGRALPKSNWDWGAAELCWLCPESGVKLQSFFAAVN